MKNTFSRTSGQSPILVVLLLISLLVNAFLLLTNNQSKLLSVSSVIDGDTFTLTTGEQVRLLGIDAPEGDRCMATQAKEKLEQLVLNKAITITEEKRDTYGRRMGLVYAGELLVNAELLRSGFARPDYTKNTQSEYLKAAYKEASDSKIGIHSNICKKTSEPPANPTCTIKGNIDQSTWDHLYHLPSCRHYNQIVLNTDLGEQYFCTEKEAQKAGFRLAPDCLR